MGMYGDGDMWLFESVAYKRILHINCCRIEKGNAGIVAGAGQNEKPCRFSMCRVYSNCAWFIGTVCGV